MSKSIVGVSLILELKYVFGLVVNPHSLDRACQKMFLISNYYLHLDLSQIFEENCHEKGKHNEKWPQKMNEVG